MEEYISLLKNTDLFKGVEETSIGSLLQSMGARKRHFDKGNFVFYAGDDINTISIVLSGSCHIVQEDYWGNRNILTLVQKGQLFGEAFAALPSAQAIVDVVVVEEGDILFLSIDSLMRSDTSLPAEARRVLRNVMGLLAGKNILLTKKIRYISQRSTRQKLMAYLSDEARRLGSSSFTIEFNRQQLADFLSADRSAMSAELSRMQKDGLIEYHKDAFTLLQ